MAAAHVAALEGDFAKPTAERACTARAGGWTALVVFGGSAAGLPAVITLVQALRGATS